MTELHLYSLAGLPSHFRERAAEQRVFANEAAARALEYAAEQLDGTLRRDDDELLTLADAAKACGYTADHLGRLVADGKLANHGRKNAPRIRRADLPVKVRGAVLPSPTASTHIGRAEIARAVINRQ